MIPGTLLRRATAALATVSALLIGAPTADATPPSGPAVAAAPTVLTGPQLAASWTGPLSTRGRWIVDATGNRFKLKSGNWAGAQGTYEGSGDVNDVTNHQADQMSHNIPLGLDRTPISRILADFHALGLNSIRLPFANAVLHDTVPVPDSAVTANPQLRGKTPLQVMDSVIAALTADGFAVVLNNHTTSYRFCCGLDGNERWNSGQTTRQWIDDWVFLAKRYQDNTRVVGADLRNEVRRDTWNDTNWGWGNDYDLNKAFEEAGNEILRADPDLLIVMEGINWQGIPTDITPHGRPMLTPVATLSNTLIHSDKLVYAAHFYGYTGPNHTGATGTGETHDLRYEELTPEQLVKAVDDQALFVTREGQHFTAPVWISEFGAGGRGAVNARERDWFARFTDILVRNDSDFAIWPLVGWTNAAGTPRTPGPWSTTTRPAPGSASSTPVTGAPPTGPSWSRPPPARAGSTPRPAGTCSTWTTATTTSPPPCWPSPTGPPATARATAPTPSAWPDSAAATAAACAPTPDSPPRPPVPGPPSPTSGTSPAATGRAATTSCSAPTAPSPSATA